MTDQRENRTPRDELLSCMKKLLVGPFDSHETLSNVPVGAGPLDYYLTGILWPQNESVSAESDEQDARADVGGDNGGSPDTGVPLYSTLRPSSIGLTCTIQGAATPFCVKVKGARYTPASNSVDDDSPWSADDWHRKPFEFLVNIDADETRASWKTSNFLDVDGEQVNDPGISVHIVRRVGENTLTVTATLINERIRSPEYRDEQCLFQTRLEIQTPGNANSRIISRPSHQPPGAQREVRINELLYRSCREFAVGHGVAASWPIPDNDATVESVWTEWLPQQVVPAVSPSGHPSLRALANSERSPFAAGSLADHAHLEPIVSRLSALCELYESWISTQSEVATGFDDDYKEPAEWNIESCRNALGRMRGGIEILEDDPLALEAFCLANRVMDEVSKGVQRGTRAAPLIWRPFQLAFLLATIRSIAGNDEEAANERDSMDLLWFPTGGGKTEAYLALIAFAVFYRRLSVNGSKNVSHIDVLMRYTLRLLTVQQFQRAAEMICAADVIRGESESRLGTARISLGLYVGGDATPNRLLDGDRSARSVLDEELSGGRPTSTPRLLLHCPLCGNDLSPTAYDIDETIPKMTIHCSNGDCRSGGEALPVYTVDDDVYNQRPSLVIGTVDKFAQLPRKEEMHILFGLPDGLPPEVIIQDELHLISGPLGTVVGLYETAIDLLCSRNGRRPKIVGSTATIGQAEKQVRSLFDRGVFQFPPPALEAGHSFFAEIDESEPDRIYTAVSSAGRSPKFTLQAVSASLLSAAMYLHERGANIQQLDPYWTLLLYFNSLRELGGADVMMRDDIPRSVKFYCNRLGCSERILERGHEELTSRKSSREIPETLDELKISLESSSYEGIPIDAVLASNMISVGMDIPRLGLMGVNGQPKTTSEYIQATSRIGRGIPGLVVTMLNAARPRDTSHFEHFRHYHQTLYRQVEASSVTPWSARARDRALHAVFVGLVRHLVPGMSGRFDAVRFDPDHQIVSHVLEVLEQRADSAGRDQSSVQEIVEVLDDIVARWVRKAENCSANANNLEYWATISPFRHVPSNPHLLRSAEEDFDDPTVWPTPNSMREVEPTAYFTLWQQREKNS